MFRFRLGLKICMRESFYIPGGSHFEREQTNGQTYSDSENFFSKNITVRYHNLARYSAAGVLLSAHAILSNICFTSYFSSHSKKRVQENYSQALELIQLLLSELLDVTKRRWSSHDAPGRLPDILVDSNVISEKIRFLAMSGE